jgi:galactose mutarotase-like enzyme
VLLSGGPWELDILPERGGRIASLRLEGRELLDQGVGVDDPGADDFVAGGAWGWDEMVPNVEAASYGGADLPDHGEAWRVSWTVLSTSASQAVMACEGRVLPWRLEREVSLGADAVRVSYALSNRGPGRLPAYWCAHPLFRYEQDMEVDVGVRLMAFAPGRSGKFFLARGTIGRARLAWRSGPAVEVAWDPDLTPYVGVWICNGDLGGYRQVAIEPATGGNDRPDPDEPPPMLGPGEAARWWLEVRRTD